MHSAEGGDGSVGGINGGGGIVGGGVPLVASPRPAAPTPAPAAAVPSASSFSVPATIVIKACSPAPAVRALTLAPPAAANSPEGVVCHPSQISATRLLELMSGKQQSPKNEAERDILRKKEIRQKRAKVARARRALLLLTPVWGVGAIVTFALSLSTHDWLRTAENMPNPPENRTIKFGPNTSPEYLPKLTYSGLFLLCCTKPGRESYSCFQIDYFPREFYLPDGNDSTNSIPYAVINSAWFFFVAGAVMSVALVLCGCGFGARKRKILMFTSGVAFIFAGLILFIGQVVYISIIKAEVANKLIPVSMLSPPRLSYRYGWSFLAIVLSFVSCEVAGTMAIFLFNYHHQYRWLCKHDQTSLANRLFFNNSALLNMAGLSAEAKQVLANKEEEDRRAATLPSPIKKEIVRRLSRSVEASVWNDLSDTPGLLSDGGAVDHLSIPVALLGNGRPTVHGSLMEIGGGGADGSMPNGCKCGGVGSAEMAVNSATIQRTTSNDIAFHSDRSGGIGLPLDRSPPPSISDRPTTTAACSPPSTTSSKSSPASRLNNRRRVNLCERHKVRRQSETTVTCTSPQLPNDDDSSVELYVCSHGGGNGHGHNHNHHNHRPNHHHHQHQNSSDRCCGAMSSNPQSPDEVSSSVDDSGGGCGVNEYPILLHSFPHHLFPHYYSSSLNGHGPTGGVSRANGVPPQLAAAAAPVSTTDSSGSGCKCARCEFGLIQQSNQLFPLMAGSPSTPPPSGEPLPPAGGGTAAAAAAGCCHRHCRLPSIESACAYDDMDKDTQV